MIFDDFSHQRQLQKRQKQREATRKAYRENIRRAREAGETRDELESIKYEAMFEDQLHEDEIEALQSRYLINKAQKYVLQTPDFDLQSEVTGLWRLSLSAQEALASKIEGYEKRRRESIHAWMTALAGIIGASTGLIGVVVGLVAVWC